jgi:hypothetical protein
LLAVADVRRRDADAGTGVIRKDSRERTEGAMASSSNDPVADLVALMADYLDGQPVAGGPRPDERGAHGCVARMTHTAESKVTPSAVS